jgi:polyhydroxyalkanoate synthesis regulator phasin
MGEVLKPDNWVEKPELSQVEMSALLEQKIKEIETKRKDIKEQEELLNKQSNELKDTLKNLKSGDKKITSEAKEKISALLKEQVKIGFTEWRWIVSGGAINGTVLGSKVGTTPEVISQEPNKPRSNPGSGGTDNNNPSGNGVLDGGVVSGTTTSWMTTPGNSVPNSVSIGNIGWF